MDITDIIELITKFDGLAGVIACIILYLHVVKCDRRAAKVWEEVNEMSKDIHELIGAYKEHKK